MAKDLSNKKKVKKPKPFVKQYQKRNEDVMLDHDLLTIDDGVVRKPLIVVHGFLSSKKTFKALFDQQEIL